VSSAASAAPLRVLAVCLGNICRSPTAEAALVEAAAQAGLALEVSSAGTGDWHIGHPPDERMRTAAAAVGLELRGTAQQVDAQLLGAVDLVVVMDRTNLADVLRLRDAAGLDTPVELFRPFDAAHATDQARTIPGPDRTYTSDEVPDPYHGGAEDFAGVVEVCRRAAAGLVAALSAGRLTGRSAPDRGGR
jgi:protein-tyrosine phosphatase